MTTFLAPHRLSPELLRFMAQGLQEGAKSYREHVYQEMAENQALVESAVEGDSFEAAFELLGKFITPWQLRQEQAVLTSYVLFEAADLVEENATMLDSFFRRAMAVLAQVEDQLPGSIFSLHNDLVERARQEGERLDKKCAEEIDKLCTPETTPPTRPLADSAEQSVEEINAQVLKDHPELRQLAEDNPDIRFLEGGDGTYVAVFGDIDTADHVATVVSGVGSSNEGSFQTQVDRSRALHHTSAATGANTATIIWQDYKAPDGLRSAVATNPAKDGAGELRDFQSGLTKRNPNVLRTVLGFSYGSQVVGEAARTKFEADNLVFVGSPGVPLAHATQANLTGEGEIYVGISPLDLIRGTSALSGDSVLGEDPAHPDFGATRLTTGLGSHTTYFEDERF